MKTVLTALVMVALCSCAKHIDVVSPQDSPSLSTFSSMLTKDKTYMVAEYYTSETTLQVPFTNGEDTYTFDGTSKDGWISSKFPCIEYHYNFRVYASGDSILFDWLDFNIVEQTFTVTDFVENEWFVLKKGDLYTKYVLVGTHQ